MNLDNNDFSFTQDLIHAFRSGTPIVYVETTEDERVGKAVCELERELGPRVLQWTISGGLVDVRQNQAPTPLSIKASSTEELLRSLRDDSLALGDANAIVVAHDLVGEHTLSAIELRLLKDLFIDWEPLRDRPQRRMLLMTGIGWTMPGVLNGYVETRLLPLLTRDEIVSDFSARRERLAVFGITPEELAERAVGLPKLSIEQVVRRFHPNQNPDPCDSSRTRTSALSLLDQFKREEIRRTGILEIMTLDDHIELGGFASFKSWFVQRKEFLLRPGRNMLRPRGVLFLGFPGCGKSHAARWIAQELKLPLVSMDIGRIQDRWVGSSEARMRTALRTLEAAAPVVLFIDEIEKALAGAGTESSGVTTRLVGQLLTWLSDHQVPVFIVATCNSAEIPPELTRAGRFDASFLVQLPRPKERQQIAELIASSLTLTLDNNALARLIEVTDGFSGAEVRQLIIEAAYCAGYDKLTIRVEHIDQAIPAVKPLSQRPKGRELVERYKTYEQDESYIAV